MLRRSLDGDEFGDGEGAAEFVPVAEDTGTQETTYIDTSVEPETRYAYRVRAINSVGASAPSAQADANTPLEGAIWSAVMRVGDLGRSTRDGETHVGYSYFKDQAALTPNRFEHEGRNLSVYALAFSEAAQSLSILTSSALDPALTLRVGGNEYAISGAASSQGVNAGHTIYQWDGVDLGWEVGYVVAVQMVPGAPRFPTWLSSWPTTWAGAMSKPTTLTPS